MLIRSLVLWPTGACDLECGYCYRGVRGGRMSPATADAALDLAAASGEPFHVQFAGGEPTLNPQIIGTVCRRIERDALPATVAVQTNAVGITPALIALLKDHRVQVGVSIDGPPEVQERLRGRAADTFAGLGLLAAHDVPVRVTTVLTSHNALRLGDLALLLAAYPTVGGLALDPLVPLGSARDRLDLVPSAPDVARGIAELHLAVRQIARFRRAPFVWRELETVRRALRAGPTPVTLRSRPEAAIFEHATSGAMAARTPAGAVTTPYCHAALGQSMAVAPDGTVYPCSQAVGDPSRAAGTVHDVDWASLTRQFRGDVALQGPCADCSLHGRCPGDCPSRLEAARGAGAPDARFLAGLDLEGAPLTCLIYRTIAAFERTPS